MTRFYAITEESVSTGGSVGERGGDAPPSKFITYPESAGPVELGTIKRQTIADAGVTLVTLGTGDSVIAGGFVLEGTFHTNVETFIA